LAGVFITKLRTVMNTVNQKTLNHFRDVISDIRRIGFQIKTFSPEKVFVSFKEGQEELLKLRNVVSRRKNCIYIFAA
jgi:hypothetical protein